MDPYEAAGAVMEGITKNTNPVVIEAYAKALDAIAHYLEATKGDRDAPHRSPPPAPTAGGAVGPARADFKPR